MRALTAITGLGVLLLGFASASLAQAPAPYKVVRNWPQSQGQRAPGYGQTKASGVACDAAGNVFVFQRAPRPVLVFNREGRFIRSWGKGLFKTPHGARFDPEGNLWLTDLDLHQVFKYTPDGQLLATAGVKGQSGRDAAHFNMPADVAFGPNGEVYVADGYGNSRVVRLSRNAEYLGEWGRRGTEAGEFKPAVHSIATDAQGRVYVADRGNFRIQVFTGEGELLDVWPDTGYVNGICITAGQKLAAVEGYGNTLDMYDLSGRRLSRQGGRGRAPGQLYGPHMVTEDDRGCLYVAEIGGNRVQKFAPRR